MTTEERAPGARVFVRGPWAPFMASCACSELAHSLVNIISVIGRDVKGFLWVFHEIVGAGLTEGGRIVWGSRGTLLLARIVDGQAGAGGAPACPAESARDFGRGHGSRHRSRERLRSRSELIPQSFASGSHFFGTAQGYGENVRQPAGNLPQKLLPCSSPKGCGLGAWPLAPPNTALGDIRGGGSLP